MFKKLKLKKKSHVSVEFRDYVIRALVVKGPGIEQSELFEIPLEHGIISESAIVDDIALYNVLKKHAPKWGGKKQSVRMFVPDTSVLMRTFDHPNDVESDKLLEYVQMELGNSIHIPFDEPLIDVYDHIEGDGKAVLYAAPSEEINKTVGLFLDVNLTPDVADIRSLCNLRLLEKMELVDQEKTYLVADWSINELSICIYSNGNVEFLRFQMIETDMTKWMATGQEDNNIEFTYDGDLADYRSLVLDQVLELDRMMNFFRFSLHKGEKSVDELIILGDNPILHLIGNTLRENLQTPLTVITDQIIDSHFPGFKAKHAALLGLALKEGNV